MVTTTRVEKTPQTPAPMFFSTVSREMSGLSNRAEEVVTVAWTKCLSWTSEMSRTPDVGTKWFRKCCSSAPTRGQESERMIDRDACLMITREREQMAHASLEVSPWEPSRVDVDVPWPQ
ncbi:uncharacterized protein ATNIH1004_008535 [Aspergillus tanneri]|uniref:Uncharacterized protein n=1 Tax=Aspergillus tanneri TaxID=1220188 RepID=A0A5M9MG66_9EURO|nr:uncharacterized protein ATNIH1004_008535 [Aspergillus tanneri]KAA8644334.1 hypothetical protein ATNIH1004_008535 [Aspergillus tanneri]